MAVSLYVEERLAIALANKDMAHELVSHINAGGGAGAADGPAGYVQTSDGSAGFVGVLALGVAHGGTGASSAPAARANLGLAIGTDVQAAGAYLTSPIAEGDVTGLVSDLAAKAPLASPTFTGTPTAPTAANGTNTTQLATTAFVLANAGSGSVTSVFTRSGDVVAASGDYSVGQVTGAAPLASPTFTGTPAAPTAATATSTTQIATCAFVQANITALALGTASTHDTSYFQVAGSYLTGNQTITLSGDVSGSGATAITTTIGAGVVTNAMLAGSIAASKLVGTDIATVGSVTAGAWLATTIAIAHGGTGATTANDGLNALLPSQGSASGKYLKSDGTNTSWATVATGVTIGDAITGGTAGRIPYEGTGPVWADSANLTFTGTVLNVGGTPVVVSGAGSSVTIRSVSFDGFGGLSPTYITNSNAFSISVNPGIEIVNSAQFCWNSAGNIFGTVDTGLKRSAAGIVAGTNGSTGYGASQWGVTDSGTTTTPTGLQVGHNTSGTAAAGFGVTHLFVAQSSTTADQNVGRLVAKWATATHASRKGQLDIAADDSTGTSRVGFSVSSDGTQAIVGFFGIATNVAQSTGWSVNSGYTVDKSFDPESTTLTEVARALGTLIDYLKSLGLLGA